MSSDTHGWQISQIKVRQKGKRAGQEYTVDTTYYPKLESAINALLDRQLRTGKADDLRELADQIRDFRAELTERFKIKVE